MDWYFSQKVKILTVFPIVITDGVRIVSSSKLNDMSSYILLEYEDWFEHEIKFIRSITEQGTKAYDIGANHGVYAFSMAVRLGRDGHVWAFEPTRKPLEMLHASVIENAFQNCVTIVPCALSDHSGTARMGFSETSETNSLQYSSGSETEEVRLETLDAIWLEQGAPPIEIVKLDAEGEEENILKGGSRFFAECSPLVMFEVKSSETHNMRLPAMFLELGYEIYRLAPGLGILVPLRDGEDLDPFQLNLFACKPDRAAGLEIQGKLARSEAPPELSRPLPDARAILATYPYAAAFSAGWGEAGIGVPLCLAAEETDRPPAERWSLLKRSIAAFEEAALTDAHPALRISWIRALRAAGRYATALRALRALSKLDAASLAGHPFLPPLTSWDRRGVVGTAEQWCSAMMADLAISSAHYSTFFDQAAWPALWGERNNPNMTVAMRRSLVLPLLRVGRRDQVPDDGGGLTRPDVGHVNDAIWRRLLAG